MFRRRLACLTIATVVLALGAAPGGDDPDELRGTWALVSSIKNGETVVPEGVEGTRVNFDGKEYQLTRAGEVLERGTYAIDARKDPREIDVKPSQGKDKGKTIRGIFRCEGKTLKACVGEPDAARPSDFDARTNKAHMEFQYRRVE